MFAFADELGRQENENQGPDGDQNIHYLLDEAYLVPLSVNVIAQIFLFDNHSNITASNAHNLKEFFKIKQLRIGCYIGIFQLSMAVFIHVLPPLFRHWFICVTKKESGYSYAPEAKVDLSAGIEYKALHRSASYAINKSLYFIVENIAKDIVNIISPDEAIKQLIQSMDSVPDSAEAS